MTDRGTVLFVHFVALVLSLAGGWYIVTQGSPLPVMDEWDLLASTGNGQLSFSWAIQHHCEHRFPLPKVIWLSALRATGFDFRAVMFLTLTLLTSASVFLLWTAREMRGYQHPFDALFPALLLHWGHGFNLVMSFQLSFALVAYALAGWLWCASRATNSQAKSFWLLMASLYSVIVIPCGGFGVTFAPAVVLWCGWSGWREWQRQQLPFAMIHLLLGIAAAAYTAWVVVTMPIGLLPTTNPLHEPLNFAAAFLGSLCVAGGSWPLEEALAVRCLLGVTVGMLYLVAILRGVWNFRTSPTPLRVALLVVMASTLVTAAATAYARGAGFADRMADASAIGFAAAWLLAFEGWNARPWLSALGVLMISAGLFWANWTFGMSHATQVRHQAWHLRRDLQAGVSPMILASRYGHAYSVLIGPRMAECVLVLRDFGLKDFVHVSEDPPLNAVPLSQHPNVVWAETPAALPDAPAKAWAIRFHTQTPVTLSRDRVLLRWIDASTGMEHESEARPSPVIGTSFLVFPLFGQPTRLRIIPGEGITELRLTRAEWLLHQH